MGYKCQVHKLEYNVAHHCNLKCDHCDHLSPFFGPKDDAFNTSISLEAFDQQLAVLSRHVHSEEFLILGGEPLLHKNCLRFFKAVKASGITDKAVLVTNGFLLDKQGDELFDVLDKITISFYPSLPLKQEAIDKARQRCQQHGDLRHRQPHQAPQPGIGGTDHVGRRPGVLRDRPDLGRRYAQRTAADGEHLLAVELDTFPRYGGP